MRDWEKRVNVALIQLAYEIKNKIKKEIDSGKLQPRYEDYLRWKVNEFEYTEKGVTKFSASSEYITKKSWFTRDIIRVIEDIKKSEKYFLTLSLLSNVFGEEKTSFALGHFIQKLTLNFLTKQVSKDDIDSYITIFLKDLKGEPLIYGAKVELDGVVISLKEKIEFNIGDTASTTVILRQTKIEDFEEEYPIYGFPLKPHLKIPSAILNIEFLGKKANEVQLKVEQAIAILRLFKVGSVKYVSYHIYSESIIDLAASGTLTAGETTSALEKSQITEEDVQKLRKFWQIMIKDLPSSFYKSGEKLNYVTIAYKRYCDALLQNGVLERRIANAVMGLESLFLRGGETQELVYRLSIRIAKIFGFLGHDSCKIKELVKDAYKVRSLFVHGSYLSTKEKKKLDDRYGSIRRFLWLLLDYLRISIVLMIFVKKEKIKDEFLSLIDDSLVDRNKEKELEILLNSLNTIKVFR